MPFKVSEVNEPREPIEVGTYEATIKNVSDAVASTGTEGEAVEYGLNIDGEERPWRETVYAAGIVSQVLTATKVLRWVKKQDSDFDEVKLDEFNTGRREVAKAYLVDAETGSLLTANIDLPSIAVAIDRKLRVRIAEKMNPKTQQSRRQIIAWMPSEQ